MCKRCNFIRKAVHFVLILSLLLTAIAPGLSPIEVLAENEPISTGTEYVFYVDGIGSGTKEGDSVANAFATLAEAYKAIPPNATKTTVVICGKVNMATDANQAGDSTSHKCLPVNNGEVIITSVYGGMDYRSENTGISIPTHWYMLSDTTFENIRIRARAYTVYANYNSLHLGEGVDISANSDGLFAKEVYLGTYSQINGETTETNNKYPITVKDIEFTMESGCIESLYGGGKYSQSYVGDTTEGKDNTITLNIKGGEVKNLYGSGRSSTSAFNAHNKSIYVNISGGTIGALYGASQNATVYGGITINISGGTVTTLAALQNGVSVTGSKIVEYKDVTAATMPTATGFDTLKLTNASVMVPSLDSATTKLEATDNSSLTLSTVPTAAISVTLNQSGEEWTTGDTQITAPAGTAEGMFMLTNQLEDDYSWKYTATDSNTTWKLVKSGEDEGGEGTADPAPTNQTVFYVDGVNGSDEADGLSAATAFKTLTKAYSMVPSNNTETTIVICGNTKPYEGAVELSTNGKSFRFPTHTGKVIITSVYGEENYKDTAKIDFESKNYYFLGATTFENISIGNLTDDTSKTGKANNIYANYFPLHLGEHITVAEWFANAIFLGTNSTINGTSGNKTPVSVADTSFTIDSCATGTVYGGGDYYQGAVAKGKNNKVSITINGGNVWKLYGSGLGGTDNAHHKSVEIVVNDGTVSSLYGAHGTATIYNDVSVNINGGTVKTLYGACKYSETGGNAEYTPHIAGAVKVTVTGGTITTLYAKEDGAQVNGDLVLHYLNAQNAALPAVQGFDTLKMTSASVKVPAGMEGLWSNVTMLEMTDDSTLILETVPTTPAQKVGVTLTKSGNAWNTTSAVITAPSGTADIFEVISPLDHSFAYDDTVVSWTLEEGQINIGQGGTTGTVLDIDLGLPEDGGYTALPANATAYDTYLQKVNDLGAAKEEVNVIQPIAVQGEIELYVDGTYGNDSNLGSKEEPFKTISKALTYVEALQEMGVDGVVVYLRAGTYVATETITLNEKHSGKNGVPVIISAYPNEKVVITSAKDIVGSAFTSVTDENVRNRLQESVKDKIVAVDLKAQGITEFGTITYGDLGGPNYQIFVNGSEFIPARYPNATNLWVGKVLDEGPIIGGTNANTNLNSTGVEFMMQDLRPTLWKNDGNIWLKGSMYAEWDIKNIRVAEIREESIKLDGGAEYGARSLESNTYYYYNILEELDAPGEYYLDSTNGILYLYPVANMSSAVVTYSGEANDLIRLERTKNVVLNGLTLENSAGNGIYMNGCEQTVVQNCNITRVGTGVVLNECKKSGVIYSDLDEIANRPIEILPAQRYFDYTPDHNFVQNCYIHSTGTKNPKFCAIYVRGTGNVISHNLLQGGFSVSIYLQYAKECIVEYNEIVGSPTGTYDGGAIYIPYGISDTGHHIRYNYIHDIAAFSDEHNPCAIYFDEGLSGNYVYGNIMSNVPCGFFTNSGSENVIINNAVLDGRTGTINGIRGESNHDAYAISKKVTSTTKTVYNTYTGLSDEKKKEVRERYPLQAALYDRIAEAKASSTGDATTGLFVSHDNYIANNVIYDCKGVGFAGTGHVDQNNIILNENPFVNVTGHDFSLKSGVDTGSWGFTYEIPSMNDIGTVRDSKQGIDTFETFIPAASEEKVNPNELLLRWTIAGGADTYELKIATNADMTENVRTETLEKTQLWFVEDQYFDYGETYYWTVTAYSTAESRVVTPVSAGNPSAFTTVTYEEYLENNKVDMTKLEASILEAKAFYQEIAEESEGGLYNNGTKATLNTAIADAEAVVARGNAQTQIDVNTANDVLQDAIYAAKTQQKIQYVTFEQLAVTDWSDPLGKRVNTVLNENTLQMSITKGDRSEAIYAPGMGIRDILCFKYKLDTKTSWNGFALAQTNTGAFITSGTDGYFICINPGQVELQKYQGGSKVVQINKAIDNTIFNGGEYYDIEIGAINNPDGSVGIHFKINDTLIFDPDVFVDTAEDKVIEGTEQTIPGKPIVNYGTFGVVVNPSNGTTYLKQALLNTPSATPDEKPEIIPEGTDKSYTKGANATVSIHCTGDLDDLVGIKMDGKEVEEANYTLKEGSIIVTFKAEYLETLSTGEHTVTLLCSGGHSVDSTFTILAAVDDSTDDSQDDASDEDIDDEEKASDPVRTTSATEASGPSTGDDSVLILWTICLLVTIGVCIYMVTKKRKVE